MQDNSLLSSITRYKYCVNRFSSGALGEMLNLNEKVPAVLKSGAPVVIYRAGFSGKIYKNILESYDVPVMCFAENNISNYPQEFNGVPVFSIFQLPLKEEEIVLIIAMDQYKIPAQLQFIQSNFRFKDVYVASEEDITTYCLSRCALVFKDKGIELQNDTLDLGFVKLHNPFNESWAYKKAFAFQAKDIILPKFGYDYLVTEGPYEYGDVRLVLHEV